jgi:hypothetical protein
MKALHTRSGRILGAVLCFAVGGAFLFGAYCSSRFAARDVDFVLASPCMDSWAQSWIWRADAARFNDMDSVRAVDAYWQALGRNPLLFGGWFAVARLERQLDANSRSEALYDFLLRQVPPSTPWRWHQFLLAADRKDDAEFAEAFNFVLAKLPQHRQEAMEVALGFWDGWLDILAHATFENRWRVLEECMARQAVDASLQLYARLEEDSDSHLDATNQARFIEFLLRNKKWSEAVDVWRRSGLFPGSLVSNGQFEEPITNSAFDWRQGRVQGLEVRRVPRRDTQGGQVMHFHFLGTHNLNFDQFWQYVPLEPGTHHVLRFAWKSERLSTDRGPYLEVRGVECALRAQSPEFFGTREWGEGEVVFQVPEECRMVRLGVRRSESTKFDSKIAGDLWLDAVELVEKPFRP